MALNEKQQELYDKVVSQDFSKLLLLGDAGTGKAQPFYSKVLTPEGWKTMGEIQPGDSVLTPEGKVSTVLKVFPQGEKDIYEVTFHDGSKARACEDHLWEVRVPPQKWRRDSPGTVEIVNTRFINDFLDQKKLNRSPNNLSIRLMDRVQTPNIDLPIDPYVLGCILGDGGISGVGSIIITTADQEIVDRMNSLLPPGHDLKRLKSKYSYSLKGSNNNNVIRKSLMSLGLWGKRSWEKEIPEVYMNAGTDQKLELLKGLFDTDGTSTENCSVSFSSSSKKMAKQVQELVWSLGGIANLTSKFPTFTHKGEKKTGRENYRVWVRTQSPKEIFSLTRKINRCPDATDFIQFCRRIKSVELVDKCEAKCILIDDPSHLYITDDYVVTHNTYTLCSALSELVRRGTNNLILCAPTHLARLNLLQKIDPDVRHLVETATVASLLLKFGIDQDDGTTQFTAGKLDKIDKYTLIALDEVSMISEQDYMLFMTSKSKVIFTGDMKQLPPVMARSCDNKMNSHSKTGNLEVLYLTQQMRQQGVIHAAAERNRVSAWFPEESVTGEAGESIIVHGSDRDMIETMVRNIINDPRGYDAVYHHRYIAYKNDIVRRVGKQVRDRVLENFFGFDTRSIPFICSEIVMMRENKKSIGYNGELVTIKAVKKDPRPHKYPWTSYELTVSGSLGIGMIRTISPCDQEFMSAHMDKMQGQLRRHQIAGEVASASAVLAEIKRIKSYWTMVQYPGSVTTHKSQGSTIENVYLNTLSFAQAPNRRALLYVGISRASKSLHTVLVPARKQLQRREVNDNYRAARAAYEDVAGESYKSVLRYLGVPTGSLEGKQIVTEYLWARVEDLKQEVGGVSL